MTGRSTPLLDRNDFDFGLKVANLEISPKILKDRKERIEEQKTSKIVNRANRS